MHLRSSIIKPPRLILHVKTASSGAVPCKCYPLLCSKLKSRVSPDGPDELDAIERARSNPELAGTADPTLSVSEPFKYDLAARRAAFDPGVHCAQSRGINLAGDFSSGGSDAPRID